MSTKFTELDDAIVQAIKAGTTNFASIVGKVAEVAKPLATVNRWGVRDHARLVDRRLQSLRKEGKIAYASREWSIVS